MGITQNELDVAPASGSAILSREKLETSEALVTALDKSAGEARAALQGTNDEFLLTPWEAARARAGRSGDAALGDDPGHAQPLGRITAAR